MQEQMPEQMTWEEFQKLPPVVLPFKCKETDFVLTHAQCVCPTCGNPTEDIRGEVYESFGVLELKIVGVCHACRMLIGNRSRVYPKRGVISQMNKGKWEDYPMTTMNQIWRKTTLSLLKPLGLGLLAGAGVSATLGVANLLFWCWWGFTALVLTGLCVFTGYRISRKK